MTNVFLVNSPLQYLIAHVIADKVLKGHDNYLVQYFDCGDFSDTFDRIDVQIGGKPFIARLIYAGDRKPLPIERIDRAFFSNRFNPAENEVLHANRSRIARICAFEDGISLYLGHYFLNPRRHDGSLLAVLDAFLRRVAIRLGIIDRSKGADFFPLSLFDEVYSVFPDVPGLRSDARRISIAEQFRTVCGSAIEPMPSACVVLSQSLVADGIVPETSYRTFLQDLLGELFERYDTVFFKTHPREAPAHAAMMEAAGCLSLPSQYAWLPVELFVAAHPGLTIVGFWSTTLVYASVLDASAHTLGHRLLAAQPENARLKRSWQSHGPILDRFGVSAF